MVEKRGPTVPVVSYGSLKPTGKQEQAGRSNLSQRDKPPRDSFEIPGSCAIDRFVSDRVLTTSIVIHQMLLGGASALASS